MHGLCTLWQRACINQNKKKTTDFLYPWKHKNYSASKEQSLFNFGRLKGIALFLFITFLAPLPADSFTGSEIIQKTFQANFVENFLAEIKLDTEKASGETSTMRLVLLGKGNPRNALSLLVVFKNPPSAKGMKLLVKSKRNEPTQVYVYMPAMGKYFLLTGEDRNMRLGDSELNLNDLVSAIPWDGTHQLLREDTFSGYSCYVIESHLFGKPKKLLTWIDKNTFLPVNTQYYDSSNVAVKTLTATKFIKAFGKYRIAALRMTNHQSMNTTTMTVLSGKWHLDIPATPFDPENLSLPISDLMNFDRKK